MEYTGVLAVVVMVIGALLLAVSPPQIASGVRNLVCAVVGQGCDAGPGAPGSGAPGSGSGGQGGPVDAADGADGDPAGAATPVSSPAGTPPEEPWCSGVWGCIRAGAGQAGSAVYNVGKGAVDDVVGVVGLVTNPGRLVDAGRYIWNNPWDAARQLIWDDDSAGMWGRGDYGGAAGRTIWNVGSMFIPGVNLGKAGSALGDLGRVGRIGAAAGGLVDEVADLARRTQQAVTRGDLDEAADLAAQAQRRADDAAADARRAGCLSAGDAPPTTVLAMAGPRRASGAVVASGSGRVLAAAACGTAAATVAETQRLAAEAAEAVESIRRPRSTPGQNPGRGGPDNTRVGSEASQAIASRYPGARTEVTYNLPNSTRRIDVLTPDGKAIESKVGYTPLNARTRKEIADDAEIMQRVRDGEGGAVSSVEWVFTPGRDGSLGPNTALRQALDDAGIPYRLERTPPAAAVPPPRGSPE